jgi:hypothetical protein
VNGAVYNNTMDKLLLGVEQGEVIISNNVIEILNFSHFRKDITKLTCNISLKKIGTFAFANNKNLKVIEFNNQLDYIASGAFEGCEIDYVVIPSSVQFIGINAFTSGILYCEAKKKPLYWQPDFAGENVKVYWKNEWKYDENGIPKPITNDTIL